MQTKLTPLLLTGLIAAMGAIPAVPALAAEQHECSKAPVTPASYTWNFKAEANRTFESVARDAAAVLDRAARLDTFSRQPDVSWQSHGVELDAIKARVNDMGSKLCRLETIRRVLDPWQQREVDRIANRVQLLADNTQDAIQYLNTYQSRLLMPAYEMYSRNLYEQADKLTHSVDNAVAYAKASHEYGKLSQKMGATT